MVEDMPKIHLSIFVLRLEVVLVDTIVYVAGHSGPFGDADDMIQACLRFLPCCMHLIYRNLY
jgi:hypothetical protein